MVRMMGAAVLVLCSGQALACGVVGTLTQASGAPQETVVRISSSWNGKETLSRDGYYKLELGKAACDNRAEIYANGSSMGKVYIPPQGNARLDIVVNSPRSASRQP